MTLIIYVSSITGSLDMKKKQQRIKDVLEGKRIQYDEVDMATDPEAKDKMREMCGDPHALPPQIFNGDQYLGNYEAFDDAVEEERLLDFLQLK